MKKLSHFIGGEQVEGVSGRFGDVFNPSTGEVIARCPLASRDEVNQAVAQAEKAFAEWSSLSVLKRMEIFMEFRRILASKTDELLQVICLESGKTYADARGELKRAMETVDFALHTPHLLKGEYSLNVGGEINAYSMKKPLGVVTCISPFNFPALAPLTVTVTAVACGNTVILKPSEKVAHSALFLAELWQEAGLPAGVWNVVNGDKEAVDALITHPQVQAVLFMGSTQVAEYVYATAAQYHKRVAAFGGGKNHMVVMPDADLAQAVSAFTDAAYGSSSQRCMAVAVVIVVGEETAEAFVTMARERVGRLKVGSSDDEQADFGPVISQVAQESVVNSIRESIQEGAELVVDGREATVEGKEQGFYLGASLLDWVTPKMRIYREEVFGPVRVIVRVETLEEAIWLINQHEYGNGATIFTQSGYTARRFTNEVEAGMVGVNVAVPIPVAYHNFAGWKRSRFGDGHLYGPDAVRFFTKSKTVSEKWFVAEE